MIVSNITIKSPATSSPCLSSLVKADLSLGLRKKAQPRFSNLNVGELQLCSKSSCLILGHGLPAQEGARAQAEPGLDLDLGRFLQRVEKKSIGISGSGFSAAAAKFSSSDSRRNKPAWLRRSRSRCRLIDELQIPDLLINLGWVSFRERGGVGSAETGRNRRSRNDLRDY